MIVLNACYPYSTVFSETICIDTDPNELSVAQKTCTTKDITSSGQGAPIAITKVEQKIVPANSVDKVKLQLTIHAKNKGDGIIINPDKYSDICTGGRMGEEDYNQIRIKSVKFSGYEYEYGSSGHSEIVCEPNPMKKNKEDYYTRCSLTNDNGIDKSKLTFETNLVIELEYGYKQTISKEIEIMNNEQLED